MRSGFVSILGRPNSGKSTLLNTLLGTKVAIVAEKPQTTRTMIQGVLHLPDAQIVFVDTPGIHRSDSPINSRMMAAVRASLDQRDLLLFLIDVNRRLPVPDREAVDLVKKANTPTLAVFNKIDSLHNKGAMLPLIEQYRGLFDFAEYIPISARTGEGVDLLRQAIVSRLPEGPPYYPADHVTDQPVRFLATELIREKILNFTHEEVPHSVAVVIDRWEESQGILRIYATILVERDGQRVILIGARGSMLKKIGTLAREELEVLLDQKIYLELHIKVQPRWREKPAFLNILDWRTMTGSDEF